MRPPSPTPEHPKRPQFRAMAMAMLPLVFGSCQDSPLKTFETIRERNVEASMERKAILEERKQILEQLKSMQNRITTLEEQVQALQDSAFVSCRQLLAQDDPLIRNFIEDDCKAIFKGALESSTVDALEPTTEGTFDP